MSDKSQLSKSALIKGAALSGIFLAYGCVDGMSSGAKEATTSEKGQCHGINSCKGSGNCGGAHHSCGGKNACKGKGWKHMTHADCKHKGGKFKRK